MRDSNVKKGTAFRPFTAKQMKALTWWCAGSEYRDCDALICDGAVRSGKTLCTSLSFMMWSHCRFNGERFALCGKTIASLRRNCIASLLPELEALGFQCRQQFSRNLLTVEKDGRRNDYYLFGGKDESSAALIQGMTLAGVLLDEVALMPRSFVEQALARCSVEGSTFWFNCNPEHPQHWFYQEWIVKHQAKNALYLHFSLRDNPSLSPAMIRRYESLYSGAFFERFVLGKWVAAEGLVYPMFGKEHIVPPIQEACERYIISCDYGTVNPASFGLWGLRRGIWYRLEEYYHDSRREKVQRTDEEYYSALERLAGERSVAVVLVDPSAASFIECIRRHGRFRVVPAHNEVADGIRQVAERLRGGQLKICENCRDIIREFALYRWDEKQRRDMPRKEHDHAMDDMRYFVLYTGRKDERFCALAAVRGGSPDEESQR